MFYAIPGHAPKAQIERVNEGGELALRVEATLGKDVYSLNEPLCVKVVVHNPVMGRGTQLKTLKATIYQTIKVIAKVCISVGVTFVGIFCYSFY